MLITRKTFVLIMLITSSLVGQAQNQEDYESLGASLDKETPILMKTKNVPGMALVIFDKGEIVYQKGIGYANLATKRLITEETGFNIGSISKLFTAWGVMKLVQDDKVDLDAPVEQYISRW